MSKPSNHRWHDRRVAAGEVVKGGYFVFRRGETTGRVKINPAKLPFEHPTLEAAMKEAKRLAHASPLVEFSVFQQAATVMVHGAEEEVT